MNLEDVIKRIQKLTSAKVTPESTFEELKIDSLDLAELVFDLEDEYNVRVNDEDIVKVKKIKDIQELFDKAKK